MFDDKVIKIESESLARSHGLEPGRVEGILKRLAGVGWLSPDFPANTALHDAFEYCEPSAVLNIFEQEDLEKLSLNVAVMDYLGDRGTPLYSLDELFEILAAFIRNQQHNRESLIQTGYPKTSFERSRWLNSFLNRLYYTKAPFDLDARRNDQGNFDYRIRWIKNLSKGNGKVTPTRNYDEGSFFDFLGEKEANFLEEGRRKIFELKINILQELSRSIQSRRSSRLWDNCLELMTKSLTSEQVEFYLHIDRLFSGYDIRSDQIISQEVDELPLVAGGVSALLDLIGHCWKEIDIGTIARTREALADLITFDQLGFPVVKIRHYFQALRLPEREIIDEAINVFLELCESEGAFRHRYREIVNEALENEFYKEIIVRTKVRRKFIHTFEPQVITFADWMKAHLEATGRIPDLSLSHAQDHRDNGHNFFYKEGKGWRIRYNGKVFSLPDTKGLRYLAILLQNPGGKISVQDLLQAVGGSPPVEGSGILGNLTDEQLTSQGLSISQAGSLGVICDHETRADLKKQIAEYQSEIEAADRAGNPALARMLREEIKSLQKQLLGYENKGDFSESIRKNITNRINESKKVIARHHPTLGRHLHNSIKTGKFCSYTPENPTSWKF